MLPRARATGVMRSASALRYHRCMGTESTPGFDLEHASPVQHDFFARAPERVAPDLLGKVLVSTAGGVVTGGRIVEAEAYLGPDDAGSHAATRAVTPRNAVMYAPPGTVYVYFTYGNHHMINLISGPEGVPGGVLIRALEPLLGVDAMTARRHGRPLLELANGPGKLASALGIDLSDNGSTLGVGRLQVYYGEHPFSGSIGTSGRVGLSAGHEAQLRFFIEGDPYVSRGRTGPLQAKRRNRAGRSGS